MRILVKDIATTLGQPDAPLVKALKEQKVAPYIFEEAGDKDIEMRCSTQCQRPTAPRILQTCGQPVLWSSGVDRCAEHAFTTAASLPTTIASAGGLPILRPLEQRPDLFVSEDNTVYDGEYKPVGTYMEHTQSLYLFEVAE